MSEPTQIKVKARELKPYHHGIWCSINGGTPFTNEIVIVQWQGDGMHIKCMLDTHNFITGLDPDEEVEVVALTPSGYYAEKYGTWTLPSPPQPQPTLESLKTENAALRVRVSELEAQVADLAGAVNR